MSRRRIIHVIQIVIVIASLAAGRAVRAEVALGASFGYTRLSYPGSPRSTTDLVGIPGSGEWGQPGLRVGYRAPSGHWDLSADVGIVLTHRSNRGGSDQSTVEVLPQIQANARSRGGVSPFVLGGLGIVHEDALSAYGSAISATRPVFGAGIGVRKSVSDGHGFIRFELRYDHLPERIARLTPSDDITFPATGMFSVKLGFDLLVAH